jgi:uncharacterized OB-fold protein
MSAPVRLPIITDDNRFYWEGTREEQLLLQRCDECEEIRHPPTPSCPTCRSVKWTPVAADGHGTVYSAVIPRHAPSDAFGSGYVVALIDLADGPRFVANVDALDPYDVKIGSPVELYFQTIENGYHLPQFRLVREASS